MINTHDILETINMIQDENLDIRTITMGISLLDCCSDSVEVTAKKIYDKITRLAKDLVKTGEAIEKELGIELVGNTKVKIVVDDEEDEWDLLDEDLDTEIDKSIDKEVKEKISFSEKRLDMLQKEAAEAEKLLKDGKVVSYTSRYVE